MEEEIHEVQFSEFTFIQFFTILYSIEDDVPIYCQIKLFKIIDCTIFEP